ELGVIDLEVVWNVALGRGRRLDDRRHLLGLLAHLDRVVVLDTVGGDVDALAVDEDMPVIDELARGKGRHREFHAIDHGVEPALEQADEIFRGVATAARGLGEETAELALADIAVIALQFLLRHQLGAEIGGLLAPLPVLAGAIIAAVQWRFRPPPKIDAEPAVDFELRAFASAHERYRSIGCCCPNSPLAASQGGTASVRVLGNEAGDYKAAPFLVKPLAQNGKRLQRSSSAGTAIIEKARLRLVLQHQEAGRGVGDRDMVVAVDLADPAQQRAAHDEPI